jgi:hypothetical protein
MGTTLVFESRLTFHVLRQDEAGESAPFLSLRLALTDAPMIYAADGAVINRSAWSMVIRKRVTDDGIVAGILGTATYAAAEGKPHCVIDIVQSPGRFAALLDMLRGGHASEITVVVGDLRDNGDYSREWNTARHASLPVTSISFEFPLPQTEA